MRPDRAPCSSSGGKKHSLHSKVATNLKEALFRHKMVRCSYDRSG